MPYTLVPNPKPPLGLLLPYSWTNGNTREVKHETVWFSYGDLWQLAHLKSPVKFFSLSWQQERALVQKGWLIEHEKPHKDYYSEPFRVTKEFNLSWAELAYAFSDQS